MNNSALRLAAGLWLASTPVGAVAATGGFVAAGYATAARPGLEPGVEPVLIVFWAVLLLLTFGGRAVAAVVMVSRRQDLARSFLLLLGPFAALINDTAALVRASGWWWVTAAAVLDLALVVAATVASYLPASNRVIAAELRRRATEMQIYPAAGPGDGGVGVGVVPGPAWATSGPVAAGSVAGRPVNAYAIVAIAMAFAFPMLGPVFGVTARNQIRYSGEQGAGLALAGILVPLALLALMTVLFTLVATAGDPNTAF